MMTYQQAVDMIDQLIHESAAHLSPPPRLEANYGVFSVPCSGPNDDQETGLVMVERDYWLRDIDQSLNDSIVEQIRRYWKERGYRVGLDRGQPGNRKIVARHPGNDFRVSITEGQRILSIGAQSTCVPEQPAQLPVTSPSMPAPSRSPGPAGGSPSRTS